MRDYYYILGCKETVTVDEIKTAYRKLSKKFHPDANGGDLFFEERFKEIQEAYDVLSHPTKKSAYDYSRKNGVNTNTRSAGGYSASAEHTTAGYTGRHQSGHTHTHHTHESDSRTVNKKSHFGFDKYYSQFKKSNRTQKKILANNAKKLVFFVLIPIAILTCSMNYITKQLNADVSNEKYQAFIKNQWHTKSQQGEELVWSTNSVGNPAHTPDKKQTAAWILEKLKSYSAPLIKTDKNYTIKQDAFSFAIDSFYLVISYSETKLANGKMPMETNKYSFKVPVADIDRITCGSTGLSIINKKNTIQQTLLNTNETVVTNQVNIGFKYNAETDLDARMVKAMNHLKGFYNYPDQKDLF